MVLIRFKLQAEAKLLDTIIRLNEPCNLNLLHADQTEDKRVRQHSMDKGFRVSLASPQNLLKMTKSPNQKGKRLCSIPVACLSVIGLLSLHCGLALAAMSPVPPPLSIDCTLPSGRPVSLPVT